MYRLSGMTCWAIGGRVEVLDMLGIMLGSLVLLLHDTLFASY